MAPTLRFLVLGLLLVTVRAGVLTFYVSEGGSGTACSTDEPCAIEFAFSEASGTGGLIRLTSDVAVDGALVATEMNQPFVLTSFPPEENLFTIDFGSTGNLVLDSEDSMSVENVVIENGYSVRSGGCMNVTGTGALQVTDVILRAGNASNDGGCFSTGAGSTVVTRVTMEGCTAVQLEEGNLQDIGDGGAIFVWQNSLSLNDVLIQDCVANRGGGISLYGGELRPVAWNFNDVRVLNNRAIVEQGFDGNRRGTAGGVALNSVDPDDPITLGFDGDFGLLVAGNTAEWRIGGIDMVDMNSWISLEQAQSGKILLHANAPTNIAMFDDVGEATPLAFQCGRCEGGFCALGDEDVTCECSDVEWVDVEDVACACVEDAEVQVGFGTCCGSGRTFNAERGVCQIDLSQLSGFQWIVIALLAISGAAAGVLFYTKMSANKAEKGLPTLERNPVSGAAGGSPKKGSSPVKERSSPTKESSPVKESKKSTSKGSKSSKRSRSGSKSGRSKKGKKGSNRSRSGSRHSNKGGRRRSGSGNLTKGKSDGNNKSSEVESLAGMKSDSGVTGVTQATEVSDALSRLQREPQGDLVHKSLVPVPE